MVLLNSTIDLLPDASLPFFQEGYRALGERIQLRLSPTYLGFDVPHGDKTQAVVIIPGFLGSDSYLREMHFWLGRIGYKSYLSNIGRNAGCLNHLCNKLLTTIEKAFNETGQSVILVAHSLGRILARAASQRRPELVKQIVSIGGLVQPVEGALYVHPAALNAANTVRSAQALFGIKPKGCLTTQCSCETVSAFTGKLPYEKEIAIFTESDGVVRPACSMLPDSKLNFLVPGSHIGLTSNLVVYSTLSQILFGSGSLLGLTQQAVLMDN